MQENEQSSLEWSNVLIFLARPKTLSTFLRGDFWRGLRSSKPPSRAQFMMEWRTEIYKFHNPLDPVTYRTSDRNLHRKPNRLLSIQ